jgi:hypothetical protein
LRRKAIGIEHGTRWEGKVGVGARNPYAFVLDGRGIVGLVDAC